MSKRVHVYKKWQHVFLDLVLEFGTTTTFVFSWNIIAFVVFVVFHKTHIKHEEGTQGIIKLLGWTQEEWATLQL